MSAHSVPSDLVEADFPDTMRIVRTPAGAVVAWGPSLPVDGAAGYAPSCRWHNTATTTESESLWINAGTVASASWAEVFYAP